MGICGYCGSEKPTVSNTIGYCADCIRNHFEEVWPDIFAIHENSRRTYGLPTKPPRSQEGIECTFCMHTCRIPEGETGYCGLRKVVRGKLVGGRPHEGNLAWYHDPLPTNCVGDFVCAGGTGCGYPQYAYANGPEHGYKNLAVFYHACSFNCLYCQNYHFKKRTFDREKLSAFLSKGSSDDTAQSCKAVQISC